MVVQYFVSAMVVRTMAWVIVVHCTMVWPNNVSVYNHLGVQHECAQWVGCIIFSIFNVWVTVVMYTMCWVWFGWTIH